MPEPVPEPLGGVDLAEIIRDLVDWASRSMRAYDGRMVARTRSPTPVEVDRVDRGAGGLRILDLEIHARSL